MNNHDSEHICLCDFSRDERAVLLLQIDRMRAGRVIYGPFNADTDTRDLAKEEEEEDLDAIQYRAMKVVRNRRRRGH